MKPEPGIVRLGLLIVLLIAAYQAFYGHYQQAFMLAVIFIVFSHAHKEGFI